MCDAPPPHYQGDDVNDEERCDESCHEAGLDACPKCDTLDWDLICDSCRYYASQDAVP